MEREIIFRGKRLDNGEWVEGHLLPFKAGQINPNRSFILPFASSVSVSLGAYTFGGFVEVAPATVEQYTGQDIQGVKLFDGDIIRRNDGMVFRVAWSNLFLGWDAHGVKLLDNFSLDVVLSKGPCEIIGNIWDTPELLEVRK